MCLSCNDTGKIVIQSRSFTFFGPCLKCEVHIGNRERADRELRDLVKEVKSKIGKRDQAMELRRLVLIDKLQAAGADQDVPDQLLEELEFHELERLAVKYEIELRIS
jgi:hypothetical protein